jgi:hypothetical protein
MLTWYAISSCRWRNRIHNISIKVYLYTPILTYLNAITSPLFINCLRSLEPWDRGFESHSKYGYLCAFLFCVCVVMCVGSGVATGWCPVQGVLPSVYRIKKLKESSQGPKKGCRILIIIIIIIIITITSLWWNTLSWNPSRLKWRFSKSHSNKR